MVLRTEWLNIHMLHATCHRQEKRVRWVRGVKADRVLRAGWNPKEIGKEASEACIPGLP